MSRLVALPLLLGVAYAQTVVVDNRDPSPAFVTTGNDWTSWGMSGHGYAASDSDYLYLSHTVGGADRRGMAVWSPTLPSAGSYRVSTWFRRTSNRTSDADYLVRDGSGVDRHLVVSQRGEGASGWVDLGTYDCAAGFGGCRVTLDGTDDDQSDEANAVRFERVGPSGVTPGGGGTPAPTVDACAGFPGLGVHAMDGFATIVRGDDWTDKGRGTGMPDSRGAHTPNVDAGEELRARGWTICDPIGVEVIERVEVAVRARTQYASGPYALRVRLDARGAAAQEFTGTDYAWHVVDITSDRASWGWADVGAVVARLSLAAHPGGRRDSDLWADAFRLRVRYTTISASAARDEPDPWTDPEPDLCEGGCVEPSDWWWDDPGDGDNADPRDDASWVGGPADDDAAAVLEPGEPDPDEQDPGDGPSDGDAAAASALTLPSAVAAEQGCGGAIAWLLLAPVGLAGRRRRVAARRA